MDGLVNNAEIAWPTALVEHVTHDELDATPWIDIAVAVSRRVIPVTATSLKGFVPRQAVANMVLCLASPFGGTISGQAISVDADRQNTM